MPFAAPAHAGQERADQAQPFIVAGLRQHGAQRTVQVIDSGKRSLRPGALGHPWRVLENVSQGIAKLSLRQLIETGQGNHAGCRSIQCRAMSMRRHTQTLSNLAM